jgi:mannose-6-phosphate isomerase-like protein (cupin superfamily)
MSETLPGGHSITIQNAIVCVSKWDLEAGASTGLHRHLLDYVVVPLTTGRLRVVTDEGLESFADLEPGGSYFRKAGAHHEVHNGGDLPLSFVEVEILTTEGRPGIG